MPEQPPDASVEPIAEMTIEQLAHESGLPVSTIRLYQTRRLMPGPTRHGRVGRYGEAHLVRLRLIGRLQQEGHSLAGIGELLRQWEEGRGLDAVIGVEASLDSLLGEAHAVEVDPADVLAHFPAGALTAEHLQRSAALGLISAAPSGKVRVIDRRFLQTGSALAQLGIPATVILDEWEELVHHTDEVAGRFISLFEQYVAPENWREALDHQRAHQLAETLGELQSLARTVLSSALDASVAKRGRERLAELIHHDHQSE